MQQIEVVDGKALSHRIPLARLKCLSEQRLKKMGARLGGEPPGAQPRQLGEGRDADHRT